MTLILCPPYEFDPYEDPYKGKVSFSASFLGQAGATNIKDDKGISFTNHGVVLSAPPAGFTGTTAYFNGTSYMEMPSKPELIFDDLDWTIDFNYRAENITLAYQEIVTKGAGIQIYMKGAQIMLAVSATNSTSYFVIGAFGTMTKDARCHIAVQRKGNKYTGFFNGIGTEIGTSTSLANTGASPLVLGAYLNGAYPILGHMQNFRATKDARYSGNFTPTV